MKDFEVGKIYQRKGDDSFLFKAVADTDYRTYDLSGNNPDSYLHLEKYRLVAIIAEAQDFSEFEEI